MELFFVEFFSGVILLVFNGFGLMDDTVKDRVITKAGMNSRNIVKAMHFIHENMDKPLTLKQVSKESGMSMYHFARIFKSATSESFKTYHNHQRIEMAKGLLMIPENSITDVCYATGFNDLSYFNRVFRKFEGVNPSSYKRKIKFIET